MRTRSARHHCGSSAKSGLPGAHAAYSPAPHRRRYVDIHITPPPRAGDTGARTRPPSPPGRRRAPRPAQPPAGGGGARTSRRRSTTPARRALPAAARRSAWRCVAWLARRREVLDQHRIDQLADRVEDQRAPRRGAPRRRDRALHRFAHGAPMHPVLVGQRPDRHLVALPVEPDRRVQLHPRPHPGPYARADGRATDNNKDPPDPGIHNATQRRVAQRHPTGWGQLRVLRPHHAQPQVGPEPRRTVGPVQSATAR